MSTARKARGPKPRRLGVHAAYASLFFAKNIKEEADRDWMQLESPGRCLRLAHNTRLVKEHYAAVSDDVKSQVTKYIEDQYKQEMEAYVQSTSDLQNLNTESQCVVPKGMSEICRTADQLLGDIVLMMKLSIRFLKLL
jgi:hypothetical protein